MIKHINFTVNQLSKSQAFYTNTLGLSVVKQGLDYCELSLGEQCANILLIEKKSPTLTHCPEPSAYWKIGITVNDLDLAYHNLRKAGIKCSTPSQFLDIGYLLHLQDPDGHTIELLQTSFKHEAEKQEISGASLLNQPAVLAHISLRSSLIEKSLIYYQENLGMTLQATMDASPYRFLCTFLAITQNHLHHLWSLLNEENGFGSNRRL